MDTFSSTFPNMTDDQKKFIDRIGLSGINRLAAKVFVYRDLAHPTESARNNFRSKANEDIADLGTDAQAYLSARFDDVDRWR